MTNEDKKDFNAMLHKNRDMPKIQIVTDENVIKKYGGEKMFFAPPLAYDEIMKKVPFGKVVTVGKIREYLAERTVLILPTLLPQEFLRLLQRGQAISVKWMKRLTGEL